MRELIENSPVFKRFLQEKISSQYLPFEQVIRLTRNVFAHSYDPKLTIIKENFIHQKVYRSSKGITKMHFLFKYAEYWEERQGDKDYGLDISINFEKLKAGTPLYTAFPLHQLYLFCELCYNLTKVFNALHAKPKKRKKTTQTKTTKNTTQQKRKQSPKPQEKNKKDTTITDKKDTSKQKRKQIASKSQKNNNTKPQKKKTPTKKTKPSVKKTLPPQNR
jgi:hypothetical protein